MPNFSLNFNKLPTLNANGFMKNSILLNSQSNLTALPFFDVQFRQLSIEMHQLFAKLPFPGSFISGHNVLDASFE